MILNTIGKDTNHGKQEQKEKSSKSRNVASSRRRTDDEEYVMPYTATESNLYDRYLDDVYDMIQTFHLREC